MNLTNLRCELHPLKNSPLITIAIPTYNRKVNLLRLLKHLDENCGPKTNVLVLDNQSAEQLTKKELEREIKRINIRYYVNEYNIGGDANILRSIELAATSPWVYSLGDSKIPFESALREMENKCIENMGCYGIIYNHRNKKKANKIIDSIDKIGENFSDFGALFLVGNSVISSQAVNKYLAQATEFTLTRMPHALFHILALRDKKNIFISDDEIIKVFLKKPPNYDPKLSLLECWAQFSLIVNLNLKKSHLKIISQKIIKMEDLESRIHFSKFCLLQIFRHRIDIRENLKKINRYRYSYAISYFERAILIILILLAEIFTPILQHKNNQSLL
jgi:glycosyltransferase involved in cell wall biosynthesis